MRSQGKARIQDSKSDQISKVLHETNIKAVEQRSPKSHDAKQAYVGASENITTTIYFKENEMALLRNAL